MVDKRSEENSDLIDRIANHPILQLLHLRRRSKPCNISNSVRKDVEQCKSKSTFYTVIPSTSNDPNYKVGIFTPKGERRGCLPARSVSTNHLFQHRLRPIGLSKSDDEILNRASDSPEEDDYLDDYREGSHTQDLANDLHSLHVTTQNAFAKVTLINSPCSSGDGKSSLPSKKPSQLVCQSSAHFRSSDKCCIPFQSKTRPLSSSLSKFGTRVQSEKNIQRTQNNFIQSELSKSQLLPMRKGLLPLKLQSPPGTAPLPVKFKKTPIAEKSPSSWFSPVRQKDLKLPVKTSFASEFNMAKRTESRSSSSSLNDSLVVLLDSGSQRDLKGCILTPKVNVKYSSIDSMATGSAVSSLESLRSSMSDGNKSIISNESAISSYRGSSLGSDSSLVTRPFLNLCTPHRSIIQSAKFQILSPISDKSQEPSLDAIGFSQKNSPQDFLDHNCSNSRQRTPAQTPRNIPEDFRNVHHILPGPPAEGQPGSDSGISIEYKLNPTIKSSRHLELPFSDLPFDMPKLRRRLAAAKASFSSSNSSISSSATSSDANARLSLPPNTNLNGCTSQLLNPTISRLQLSSGVSRTSSSNSSDWESRSSAESSEEQGTPKLQSKGLKFG